MPATFAFSPRMLGFELPADLLGTPLGKTPNSAPQDGGETNTSWARLVCWSTVGEGFLTSMNPISSQGDVREKS